jgi:serine/threonine protein kinase
MQAGIPERYGKYEVLRPLATGGMADLFLARSRGMHGFETLAVVKRIRPHLAANPEFVRLFLDEARLAAQLRHPNVVHVYDIGQERGEYFFVMEYLHGRDLRAVIEAARKRVRPLSFDETLSIVIGLCAGLHHAHERLDSSGRPLGLVHRDISPSNVMIDFEGNIKLMDFGIAKATQAASRLDGEGDTNSLRGKLSYMSPEQCLGKPLDRRTDLYSLAVVLYEMTTFAKPHGKIAESEFLAMKQTLEAAIVPPSQRRRDFPLELEAIVVRGLAREREDRWSSARELQLELEAFARKQRLALSGVTLARLMEELFPNDLHAWQEAQSRGASLSQHLEESHTLSLQAARAALPQLGALPALPAFHDQKTQTLAAKGLAAFATEESGDPSGSGQPSEPATIGSNEAAWAQRKRRRGRLALATAAAVALLVAATTVAEIASGHKAARPQATAATALPAASPVKSPTAATDDGPAVPAVQVAARVEPSPHAAAPASARAKDATARRPPVRPTATPARTRSHAVAKRTPSSGAHASGWDPEAPLLPH